MNRNVDGTWRLTSRMFVTIAFLIPLFGTCANVYMSNRAIEAKLDAKMDRGEYILRHDTLVTRLQQHMEIQGLLTLRLFLADSLLLQRQIEMLAREREVCIRLHIGC